MGGQQQASTIALCASAKQCLKYSLQEILDSVRLRAAHVGVPLRPAVVLISDNDSTEQESLGDVPDRGLRVGERRQTYSETETLFLRVVHGKQGVLQIHKAGFSIDKSPWSV